MLPTKEQILEKKGYHIYTCVDCGGETYYKYKSRQPRCEGCKAEKHIEQSRNLNRMYRAKKLLAKSPNKFKTKYVVKKLNETIEELALTDSEIRGALKYFLDTLYMRKDND